MFDDLVSRFWKRSTGNGSSRAIAKNRLQVVLVHDRAGMSPRTLENFRKDLVKVISQYFEIDATALEIDIQTVEQYRALLVNTPIIRAKAAVRS